MKGLWACAGMQLWKGFKYATFLHIQVLHKVLNMPEYGWIMLGQIVLTMTGFWICLGKVSQGFEYASGYKCQGLEYGKVVNMGELHRVLNMPKLAWKCLKKYLSMREYAMIMLNRLEYLQFPQLKLPIHIIFQ